MANSSKTLSLTILDREYRVNCPEGAEERLHESARLLDQRMQEIKQAGSSTGKVLGPDRVAVIAALNMANELIELRQQDQKVNRSMSQLCEDIDHLLEQDQQLEL
ncbi:cell division protein ZapA [Bacterioplanes sanyensis]|uniref:Cell division protein ZapA n=1 Tax=Bacterioplanes sanyensis TaxID=1249553 RepID=A0A222FHQ5_9GAMM|nr:cell division protein ZapA [Bacterioplanes sanyensis]ASP37763.1 cell division protein ZapA [Bacterioplanes sanyensis]